MTLMVFDVFAHVSLMIADVRPLLWLHLSLVYMILCNIGDFGCTTSCVA